MIYIYSFMGCGFICAISQYVLEKTHFTPGHMNTLLVIFGCILSGFGVYDILLEHFHAGISVTIMNFGHLLVTGAGEYFKLYGFFGLFKGVLVYSSLGISFTIFVSFITALLFKSRN